MEKAAEMRADRTKDPTKGLVAKAVGAKAAQTFDHLLHHLLLHHLHLHLRQSHLSHRCHRHHHRHRQDPLLSSAARVMTR